MLPYDFPFTISRRGDVLSVFDEMLDPEKSLGYICLSIHASCVLLLLAYEFL
jgi:hypothetical protein